MPSGLKRYYGKGHWHFVTFSGYRRLQLLQSARPRDTFVRELRRVGDQADFRPSRLCSYARTCGGYEGVVVEDGSIEFASASNGARVNRP